MRENNPKIDKIMGKKQQPESKLKEIVRLLKFGCLGALGAFWLMVLGEAWITWQSNLMAPGDCLQVMNEGLLHDEVGVTPKKCDSLKEKGIIKYDVEADYWVLVNPNNK